MGFVILLVLLVVIVVYINTPTSDWPGLDTQVKETQVAEPSEDSTEPKDDTLVYTEEDVALVLAWSVEREKFKESGTRGKSAYCKWLGTGVIGGAFLNILCFPLLFVLFLVMNDYGGLIPSWGFEKIWPAGDNGGNPMALLGTAVIVALAVVGVGSIYGWIMAISSDSAGDDWMKKEIERSEKMLAVSEQKIKEQYEDKYNKLLEEKNSLESNLLLSKAEKDSNKQIADEQIKDYKKKLKELQQDYSREKKIWGLEKREMQYQLRLSKGLAKEVKDSDSPLGGLYGEED